MSTYVSKAPTESSVLSRTSGRARTVACVAALLFGAGFFLTVASVNVPHDASDAKLLDWWQDSGKLNSGLASEFFAIMTAVLFVVLINYVRTVLEPAAMPQWTAFASSMASAFTVLLLVSAALRGVIGHMVQLQDEPLPGIDVLRYSTGLNYTLIGTATMAAFALATLAVSVVIVRSSVLARWAGYVGLGTSLVTLAAVAVGFGAFTIPLAILWAVCMSVALWRQPTA
jgi:hypothetical protein